MIDDFKISLLREDLSKNTINNYLVDLNKFVDWYTNQYVEQMNVKNIAPHHLNFYRAQMVNYRRLKISTINRKNTIHKKIF